MFKPFLFVAILSSIAGKGFSQINNFKKYPKVKFAKVGEAKADTLQFRAVIKSTYKCPPCPEGAQCKPCIGDHVLVTNGNSDLDFRVFTHQPSLFKVGEVYTFLVRFRSELHRIDNIELVTSKKEE